MEEYVQLPDFMKNYRDIESVYFNKYILSNINPELRIDMTVLRNIYMINKQEFMILRDELILRGCEFILKNKSYMFPVCNLNNNAHFVIYQNKNKYKYVRFD